MEKIENIEHVALLANEPWLSEKKVPTGVFDARSLRNDQLRYIESLLRAARPIIEDLKTTRSIPEDYTVDIFKKGMEAVHRVVLFSDMVRTARETVAQADSTNIAVFLSGIGKGWGYHVNNTHESFYSSDVLMAWMVQFYARKAGKHFCIIKTRDDALIISKETSVILIDDCAYSGLQVSDKIMMLRDNLGGINPHKIIISLAGCTLGAYNIINNTISYLGSRVPPIVIIEKYIPSAKEILGRETIGVLRELPYVIRQKYSGGSNELDIYDLASGFSTITWSKIPDKVSLHPLFVSFEDETFLQYSQRKYPSPQELEEILEVI